MTFSSSKRSTATTTTTFVLLLLSLVHVLALSFLVSPRRYSTTAKMEVFASAAKPPTTTTREAEEKNEKNAWHVSISVLGGGRNSRGKKEKEEEEDVEARNGGFSRVRHESTLKAVLALATKRDDDETDENLVRREEDEEEETEKTLSARFSAEDFARKRDVILISVCSSGVGGGEGSFVSSSFSSPSPTHSHSWSASSAMYEFAAKAKASSSCAGSESVSMQCNRAEFLEIDGGGKREKADAYERAMVSETGVKSRDVLTSSALRRLSEELACFSERSAERFGEGKVSSSRDTSEIEVAYAEICGMAALDGLDATERKKIERFVEKKIEDVLERVGALGVMVVAQAREVNEIVESQRKRRALLQENDSSEDGRSAKEYPNKAAATIVGFILLLGAVAGFLAMLTMPFPTDSLLFPKTKGD